MNDLFLAGSQVGKAEFLTITRLWHRLARNEFAGLRDALIQRLIGVDDQLGVRDRLERGFEALIEIERAVGGRVMAGGGPLSWFGAITAILP